MYSVNCRWSLIEVRARCSEPDFSVTDSQQSMEALYATSETVGRYHTARPQSGSYIAVLATSLRDCLRQTARIYIGRELYVVHTDATADKARGNSSGVASPSP